MRYSIFSWCVTTICIIFCAASNTATGTVAHEATTRTTTVVSPPSSYSSTAFVSTGDIPTATRGRRGRNCHQPVEDVFDKGSFFILLSSLSSSSFKAKTRMNMHPNRRKIIEDPEWHLHQQLRLESLRTNNHKKETLKSISNTNRRKMLVKTALLFLSCNVNTIANAACLSGDTSSQCIGVYKMPIDDRANVYVETPEQLAKYAPDVKWVPPVTPPKSYKEARMELGELQINCYGDGGDRENVNDMVLKGQLEKAGVELLRIVPRITVVGRVIIGALYGTANNDKATKTETTTQQESLSMRAYRAEVAYDELLGRLGEVDVLIGQALRGQLGVSAAAQIQILAELKEAKGFLDDFVKAIPDDFRG